MGWSPAAPPTPGEPSTTGAAAATAATENALLPARSTATGDCGECCCHAVAGAARGTADTPPDGRPTAARAAGGRPAVAADAAPSADPTADPPPAALAPPTKALAGGVAPMALLLLPAPVLGPGSFATAAAGHVSCGEPFSCEPAPLASPGAALGAAAVRADDPALLPGRGNAGAAGAACSAATPLLLPLAVLLPRRDAARRGTGGGGGSRPTPPPPVAEAPAARRRKSTRSRGSRMKCRTSVAARCSSDPLR
jgi:hypothetical protein